MYNLENGDTCATQEAILFVNRAYITEMIW